MTCLEVRASRLGSALVLFSRNPPGQNDEGLPDAVVTRCEMVPRWTLFELMPTSRSPLQQAGKELIAY